MMVYYNKIILSVQVEQHGKKRNRNNQILTSLSV